MSSNQANAFIMCGARDIMSRTSQSAAIGEQTAAIESAVETSPGLVFDLCRALIESTCKTILHERGISCESLGYKNLLDATYGAVSLVPDSFDEDIETKQHIEQLIVGFDAVLRCVTHLRHTFGICSHGKHPSTPSLETAHAMLAAQAADALCHFLFMAHKYFFAEVAAKSIRLEDQGNFNDYVDSSFESMQIFDVVIAPSTALFHVDPTSYQSYLSEFEGSEGR